jgi:hypothetical protein
VAVTLSFLFQRGRGAVEPPLRRRLGSPRVRYMVRSPGVPRQAPRGVLGSVGLSTTRREDRRHRSREHRPGCRHARSLRVADSATGTRRADLGRPGRERDQSPRRPSSWRRAADEPGSKTGLGVDVRISPRRFFLRQEIGDSLFILRWNLRPCGSQRRVHRRELRWRWPAGEAARAAGCPGRESGRE